MNELERKLNRLYGNQPIKRDIWGKRTATAREIESALDQNPEFSTAYLGFLPDEADVAEKDAGIQPKNKKHRA